MGAGEKGKIGFHFRVLRARRGRGRRMNQPLGSINFRYPIEIGPKDRKILFIGRVPKVLPYETGN